MPQLRSPSPRLDFSPKREQTIDWRAGYTPVSEHNLHNTGLRGSRLLAVIICLVILWILAILTLMCNILLLVHLRMGPRGLDHVQFLRVPDPETGTMEHWVQFKEKEVDLGSVLTRSGKVGGYKNQSLNILSSRLILSSGKEEAQGSFIMENEKIRADGFSNLMIVDADGKRPFFSANHPRLHFSRKSIQRIASKQIISNKVRSPVDSKLRIEVDNVSFRGNERTTLTAKSIRIRAQNNLGFRTSPKGAIRFQARKSVFLSDANRFNTSSSPRLTASVLGYRLCLCSRSNRVFTVPGNKFCTLDASLCF